MCVPTSNLVTSLHSNHAIVSDVTIGIPVLPLIYVVVANLSVSFPLLYPNSPIRSDDVFCLKTEMENAPLLSIKFVCIVIFITGYCNFEVVRL